MKNILITGGSRGIGESCVRAFSNAGYRVFFTYKNSHEKAKALKKECGAIAINADVCHNNSEVFSVIKPYGKIYALINNAGISEIKIFQDITENDWDMMFNTNVKGMFLTTKGVVDDMIGEKCGRIINISSIWGIRGASCEVHYSASKSAIIGFTKALAKELGPSGITVNCIAPGVIDTDMNKNADTSSILQLKEETPIGRLGTPQDIASLALFLCGDGASFITGQIITADGGLCI